jgi:hypothetical protein
MLRTIVILGAAAGLLSGPAAAQSTFNPAVTTICLDVGGQTRPVTCQSDASRVQQRENICQCLRGGQPVTVSVCPPGVRAPAESAAFERERYSLVHNGSLVGATTKGQLICVARRDSLGGR